MRETVIGPLWTGVSTSLPSRSIEGVDTMNLLAPPHDTTFAEPEARDLVDLLADEITAAIVDELVDDLLDTLEDHTEPVHDTSRAIARCSDGQGTLTHLFFSDDEFDLARAKAICRKCRLAESCLSGALERSEAYGVWGGELLIDGAIVAVKRGRGRPPKNPRPVLVVDEVPLPPHLVA